MYNSLPGSRIERRVELTILMPCLDEALTVATCVRKACGFLQRSKIQGEVLVADNGSSDGSQAAAAAAGARVVQVTQKGYGAALMGGIRAAAGLYVIMGDADDSYDFENLDGFVGALREGHDLVMGNRFRGGIKPGAMPPLNRYLGNPVLSGIGRLLFHSPIGDFHCGLRGFNREMILQLGLITPGMEFATEMVVKAALAGLRVTEVPTTLSPDGRNRAPHLRPWRDGWRHLRFMLAHSSFSRRKTSARPVPEWKVQGNLRTPPAVAVSPSSVELGEARVAAAMAQDVVEPPTRLAS